MCHLSYSRVEVQRLDACDAEAVLRFVAGAGAVTGDDPFPPAVLEQLGRLVRADRVSYCEQDRLRCRTRLETNRSGDSARTPACTYWEIADEHPVCSHHNTGDVRALKVSDFIDTSALRKTRLYRLWFAPSGIEHELDVAIPSPPWHTKTFLFARRRHDFDERDRLILDLLQPHFGRLWREARTRRVLRATLEELERGSTEGSRAVIVLDGAGGADYVSGRARSLLRTYFGGDVHADPLQGLAAWLASRQSTLVRTRGRATLTLTRSNDTLLLEERVDIGLTPRERQVMVWVARGKTNKETARILAISPGTVRRHLENTYRKLGVTSRTAAAARFLAVLDRADRSGELGAAF